MSCNCEPKKYSISMGCCEPVLGPIEAYYTKFQIDKMLEEIESGITSGCCITPEEVESAITSAMTIVEGEIPSLSGYATEQWVLDKHYISGVDLSDYALKSEIPTVPTSNTAFTNDAGYLTEHQPIKTINGNSLIGTGDIEIGTGGTIDLSNYYTTAETVNLVESAITIVEGEIPSLSGYATEQWVEDKHYITGVDLSDYVTYEDLPDLENYTTKQWVINQNYVTNSELIQYITNLQNQIDSLKEQISGCCGDTGETITRWITMTGASDYTCSGTTKYTKEKEQTSTDGGNTWSDTGNYRSGSTVLEQNSVDCGFVPTFKFYTSYYDGNERTVACDSSNRITSAETRDYTSPFSSITNVIIGNCVTQIDDFAFGENGSSYNYVLKSVYMPNTVTSIGEAAFSLNRSLDTITISSAITEIKAHTFEECNFKSIGGWDSNAQFKIPSGVTSIGQGAFFANYLNNIEIPSNVKNIGNQAFGFDSHAGSADTFTVILHEGLETIGRSAFEGCFKLKTLTIPSTVTIIDWYAINHCTSLESLTCLASVPPTVHKLWQDGWGPDDYSNFKIYVPSASVNAYKAADGWSNYENRIQAIP